MSLTISIRFLTGRANLHHWQAHHSDGKLDWPPSPWRLLRSLVAVAGRGMTSLPWPPHMAEMTVVVPGTKTVSKKGIPKPTQEKLDWQKAKRRLRLVELLTDGEAAQFRTANPWQGFDAALKELQARALRQVPVALCDTPNDDLGINSLISLLSSMSDAPEIWLPRSSHGHTRQYFPIHEEGIVKPSGVPVFDTFAVVDKNLPVHFQWPYLELSEADPQLNELRRILSRMTYFGRAESWCEATAHVGLKLEEGPHTSYWKCVCAGGVGQHSASIDDRNFIVERKLAPIPIQTEQFRNEVLEFVWRVTPRLTREAFRQTLLAESNATMLLRCLLRESSADIASNLDRPIGTRWVHYAVPRAIFDLPSPRPKTRLRPQETIQVVRYALNSVTMNRPVLPPLTDTLLIGGKFRDAALAIYGVVTGKKNWFDYDEADPYPRNLCGHERDRKPLCGHTHAFFWPTDEDNDGFLDHVTVYCPAGFEQSEVDALRRLVRIRQRGGRPDLLVTPVFLGKAEAFGPWQLKPGAEPVRSFVSATPYFCPLHLTHGKNGSGKLRPITPILQRGLVEYGITADVKQIDELVFDYAPADLAEVCESIAANVARQPIPPRQFFPVIEPPSTFPSLSQPDGSCNSRYKGACIRNADDPQYPFGLTVGLLVNHSTRFVRTLSFCRRRRDAEVKGPGRLFRITFRETQPPRPFALGDQCHFGLGLFVPEMESAVR
ncbi:MAG: hypothetical protein DWH80_07950 [Planctomycetota bacterium]|nr:MAG: hypothetical protein DWH80_07950 [Planctomycetota bacterium]